MFDTEMQQLLLTSILLLRQCRKTCGAVLAAENSNLSEAMNRGVQSLENKIRDFLNGVTDTFLEEK